MYIRMNALLIPYITGGKEKKKYTSRKKKILQKP